MCLALSDDHGHAARLVTNNDTLVVSVLVEAHRQLPRRGAPLGDARCAGCAAQMWQSVSRRGLQQLRR
jgi:hypothetical protein